MSPFNLKKWYFDLVTPGGDAVYSYFITVRIAGFGLGLASTHLRYANGEEVRASERTGFAGPDAGGSLGLGGHSFVRHESWVDVRLAFENISLDLRYTTLAGGWDHPEEGKLWSESGRTLLWEVAQSAAAVEGTITTASGKSGVSGLGYQDVVETSIPPWKLPIGELIWGRAHFKDHVIVFNQVKTRDGEILQNLLLRTPIPPPQPGTESHRIRELPAASGMPLDTDRSFSHIRGEHGRDEAIVHPDFRLTLGRSTVLEDSPIATAERLQPRFLRRLLNRACGNPVELKMLSTADLEIGGGHHRGWALHERVAWHWPIKEPK